jgi:hypothetical protein
MTDEMEWDLKSYENIRVGTTSENGRSNCAEVRT